MKKVPPPPPPPPKSRMGKLRVFALLAASSLIWGGGRGGVLFHVILSKNVEELGELIRKEGRLI